jgi:hypothetical protein
MVSEGIKKAVLRISGAGLFFLLLYRILVISKGPDKILRAIAFRTYKTESEQEALVLISCCVLLLLCLFLSLAGIFAVLIRENKKVSWIFVFLILSAFYLFCCLSGYTLLNNHFTTAFFMTGKYTAKLLKSLLDLFTGIFGERLDWDSSVAWHAVSACLFFYPFAVIGAAAGWRNFASFFLEAVLFTIVFFGAEFLRVGAVYHILLGLLVSFLASAGFRFLTDDKYFGSEKKKKSRPVVRIKIDTKKRTVLILAGAVLWVLTVLAGRVSGFAAFMRLAFGSDIYKFQNSTDSLGNLNIAKAFLVSYLLSLLVRQVLQRFQVEDESRLSGIVSASYMLLLQVWIMPLLSSFIIQATGKAKVNISESDLNTVAAAAENPAGSISEFINLRTAPGIILGCVILAAVIIVLIVLLFLHVAAFKYVASFLIYFSVCTYVTCLAGLFYERELAATAMLLICYLMNRLLNLLLSIGPVIRKKVTGRS